MRNVTDRTSNPFGMRPPRLVESGRGAVHGYGDANADFHLVGDYPGVHGGTETGVPFTGTPAGRRLLGVLRDVGLLADADEESLEVRDLFMSYLHASVTPEGRTPDDRSYDRLEAFFDAELRAIAAHVLLPVGDRAVAHVLERYTAHPPASAREVHATEISGGGFLVVPAVDPAAWDDADEAAYRDALRAVLSTDYRRVSDLGRFLPDDDPYLVR